MKINGSIEVPDAAIEEFCKKWKITHIELFGSAVSDDFGPASDIDLLVTFEPNDGWGLFDLVRMENEIAAIIGRPVDLVERAAIEQSENYIRRRRILSSARLMYSRV